MDIKITYYRCCCTMLEIPQKIYFIEALKAGYPSHFPDCSHCWLSVWISSLSCFDFLDPIRCSVTREPLMWILMLTFHCFPSCPCITLHSTTGQPSNPLLCDIPTSGFKHRGCLLDNDMTSPRQVLVGLMCHSRLVLCRSQHVHLPRKWTTNQKLVNMLLWSEKKGKKKLVD